MIATGANHQKEKGCCSCCYKHPRINFINLTKKQGGIYAVQIYESEGIKREIPTGVS